MKKILLILTVLSLNAELFAQIGGISASKLLTLCTLPVANKSLEFEPAFGFGYSNKSWDNSGEIQNSDSTIVNSGFGFRFSYGAWDNLEIGTALPVDMSGISFGLKYKLPFGEKFTTALLLGTSTPLGNQLLNRKKKNFDNTTAAVGGIVATYEFTENLSLDFDAQYQKFTENIEENHKNDIFLNSDLGLYINGNFQAVIGLNYQSSFYDNSDNN